MSAGSEFLTKEDIRKNWVKDLGNGKVEIMDKIVHKRKNYCVADYKEKNVR